MGSFAGFHFQSKSQLISFMANQMRAYCGNCCKAFSGVRVHVRILYRVAVDADTFCLATSVSANSPILYNGNVYGYGGMRVENCIFYSPGPHHCHTRKYWFDKKPRLFGTARGSRSPEQTKRELVLWKASWTYQAPLNCQLCSWPYKWNVLFVHLFRTNVKFSIASFGS